MRISHKNKFIFLSNPKSGSTSIRMLLNEYSDVFSISDFKSNFKHHVWARQLKKEFEIRNWNWDDYYVFTTVRNPWAKVVSFFIYGRYDDKYYPFYDPHYNKETAESITFEDWMENGRHKTHRTFRIDEFTQDWKGASLVDDVLKIEEIDLTLPKVFKKIGIELKADKVPIKNTTDHKPYQEFYTKKHKEYVKEWFKYDIERFGYEF